MKSAMGLFLLMSFGVAEAQLREITLEEAIQIAGQSNPALKSMESEVAAAEARKKRTGSYFLPRLGAESRYEVLESSFQKQRGATSNLFLEWNVFNGFRDWYDRKSKEFEVQSAQMAREKQSTQTKADVEASFYKLLAGYEAIRSYEEALQRNQAQREAALRRQKAGLASEGDILEFDIYQTELEWEVLKLKTEVAERQARFRVLLGESNEKLEFRPKGKLFHYHVEESLAQLRERVAKESQSLQGARFELERSQAATRVANGGYLPQLDLRATYGSRGINETEVAPETAVMGVARWEFFSGFDTTYGRAEASALAARAESLLRQTEMSVLAEVDSSFQRLKMIQDRVDVEAENKIKAKKFFDVVASEYKRGVKNSNDLRAASQLLLQVVVRDIQHRSDFFEQKAALEKAVGGSIQVSRGSQSGHTD